MIGIIGIILAIIFFIFMSFKNVNLTVTTLLASLIVIILGGLDLWAGLSDSYATSFKNFAGNMFLVFFCAAILGKILEKSGAAKSMALAIVKRCGQKSDVFVVLAILLVGLVFSFCGMGLAGVFTIFPICMCLFKMAGIPRKFFNSLGMCVAGTIGQVIPGAPSTTNIYAATTFGTSIYAAPLLGAISCILMFGMLWGYFVWAIRRCRIKGETFVSMPGEELFDLEDKDAIAALPSAVVSFIPFVVLIVMAFVFQKVSGNSNYAVVLAICTSIIVSIILFYSRLDLREVCQDGIRNGSSALIIMSSVAGFGGVVSATQAYQDCVTAIFSVQISPLVTAAVSINIMAAILASNTSSVTLFCNTLGQSILASGVNAQLLHRVVIQSGIGFDAMPFASGIVMSNDMQGTKLSESYPAVFISQVAIPVITLIVVIVLGSLGVC